MKVCPYYKIESGPAEVDVRFEVEGNARKWNRFEDEICFSQGRWMYLDARADGESVVGGAHKSADDDDDDVAARWIVRGLKPFVGRSVRE